MLCRAKHGGHKAVHQKAEVWVRSREQPDKRTSSPKSRGTATPGDAWPAAARRMHAHGRGVAEPRRTVCSGLQWFARLQNMLLETASLWARGAAPRARVPLGQGWDAVCVTCGEPHGLFGCEQLDAEMEAEARRLAEALSMASHAAREKAKLAVADTLAATAEAEAARKAEEEEAARAAKEAAAERAAADAASRAARVISTAVVEKLTCSGGGPPSGSRATPSRSRSVHRLGRQSPARALELTEWELALAGT